MTTTRACRGCGIDISDRRLQAVPHTPWCVTCAETRVERIGGNMIWSHKTGAEIELKPEGEATAFALRTRRFNYNACIGVSSPTAPVNLDWEE